MNDRHRSQAHASQAPDWVRHRKLREWVAEMARLAKPDRVLWCDGSQAEYDGLCAELVAAPFLRLYYKRGRSFLALLSPAPTWRAWRTAFHLRAQDDAGPTNTGSLQRRARERSDACFDGCMRGRTLYVVPCSMGPWLADREIGVEPRTRPTRVTEADDAMGARGLDNSAGRRYLPCSLWSAHRAAGAQDVSWPATRTKSVVQFPRRARSGPTARAMRHALL